MENQPTFFELLSKLTQAHIIETQALQKSCSESIHSVTEALRLSQRDCESIRTEFIRYRDTATVLQTSLETQLTECQTKLSKAIKKLRVLLLKHPSSINNINVNDPQIDALESDLTSTLNAENNRLRIRLAEVERLREVEVASYTSIVRDLQRENAALLSRAVEVEDRWMQKLLEVAGIGRSCTVEGSSMMTTHPPPENTSIPIQQSKRLVDPDETQIPSQRPISKKQKLSPPPTKDIEIPVRQFHVEEPKQNNIHPEVASNNSQESLLCEVEISEYQTATKAGSATKAPSNPTARFGVKDDSAFKLPTPRPIKPIKYQEVVRDKDERKKLHAVDCPCCSEFYVAAGHVPPIRELGHVPGSGDSHLQTVSRHRAKFGVPDTPEGFWDVGFPTTQEISDRRKSSAGGGVSNKPTK